MSDWRKNIQISLIAFIIIAIARVGFIFYERNHVPEVQKPQPSSSSSYKITLDDYVTPRKLYPYDLKSAREVVGKTVWVRSGNECPYYPYSTATHSVSVKGMAGLLAPLENLEVKDVVVQNVHGQKQVMAIFVKAGSPDEYGVAVGKVSDGSYDFFINDVFFIEDPHQLYSHWPADVWDAIDHRQVKIGMNERQAALALGTNIRATAGDYGNRTVQYIIGKQSTMVSFSDNKAVSVEPGPPL